MQMISSVPVVTSFWSCFEAAKRDRLGVRLWFLVWALIVGVYFETGAFTALAIGLVYLVALLERELRIRERTTKEPS